jgi:hypothetical protein
MKSRERSGYISEVSGEALSRNYLCLDSCQVEGRCNIGLHHESQENFDLSSRRLLVLNTDRIQEQERREWTSG